MSKNLIVGAISKLGVSEVAVWINSIKKIDFSGDVIVFDYGSPKETLLYLAERGVSVFPINFDHLGNMNVNFLPNSNGMNRQNSHHLVHNARFFHIYMYLKQTTEYDKVLISDVRDVAFMKDPFEYPTLKNLAKGIMVVNENLHLQNEPWNRETYKSNFGNIIYEFTKELTILNCGVVAGTAESIRDYALLNYLVCVGNLHCDQMFTTLMGDISFFKDFLTELTIDDGFTLHCGTNLDKNPGKDFTAHHITAPPSYGPNGLPITSKGDDYYIIHQYDRIPELRKLINEKY